MVLLVYNRGSRAQACIRTDRRRMKIYYKMKQFIWIAVFVICGIGESVKHPNNSRSYSYKVDLCSSPSPDPCHPGGKWDPLLNKYASI